MTIAVDRDVCSLNAECVYSAPDIFRIVDGELVSEAEPGTEHARAVQEAVNARPNLAISIVEGE